MDGEKEKDKSASESAMYESCSSILPGKNRSTVVRAELLMSCETVSVEKECGARGSLRDPPCKGVLTMLLLSEMVLLSLVVVFLTALPKLIVMPGEEGALISQDLEVKALKGIIS